MSKKTPTPRAPLDPRAVVDDTLAWLARTGSQKNVDGMARYGITTRGRVFGVSVGALRARAKTIGRDHDVARALFETDVYEARMLACFVDEPSAVTPAQMDAWCRTFDNWAICDTACFHLFDKTPHAFRQVHAWATRAPEFERRAAFALLASLALHLKGDDDEEFIRALPLVDAAASDGRNFVKKAVSWALKGMGMRSRALHTRAVALATALAASDDAARRFVGRDALRDLQGAAATKRLARKDAKQATKKTPAKKTPAKKTPAKKTPAKKAAASTTTAKRSRSSSAR